MIRRPMIRRFGVAVSFAPALSVLAAMVLAATLVGPNSDAHVFSPTPSDAKTLGAAKAVFINGMGLEGWIARLAAAAGTKTTPIVVSTGITPRQAEEGGHHTI